MCGVRWLFPLPPRSPPLLPPTHFSEKKTAEEGEYPDALLGSKRGPLSGTLAGTSNLGPLQFPPARLETPAAAPKVRPHIHLVIRRQGLAHPIAFAMSI
jgi:hypothetical protein